LSNLPRLHRRLLIVMALAAVAAFVSGAGIETPWILIIAVVLVISMVWEPSERVHARLEWFWRIAAFALALRALYHVVVVPEDVVLPMVDVLLALLASEVLRPAATTEQTRIYSLSFALLVAAAAYRAGATFGIAFIVYITAATVTLMLGHLIREGKRFEVRPPALSAGFLIRVASLASVMLFMSGLLFVAFPRVTRSWMSRETRSGGAIVGFSDRVSLGEHGGRIYPNPEIVLRVEFPTDTQPPAQALYWRGRSYDHFDGVGWWRSPRARAMSVPVRTYQQHWPRARLRTKIYATELEVPVLFILHPVVAVQPISRMRWQPDPSGDVWYDAAGPPIYRLVSGAVQPSDSALRSLPPAALAASTAYLQLPQLSPAVNRLADSLTTGHTTQIDRVRAVENWLRSEFRYTLQLPRNAREATLEHFLFERRAGHCEYFSTALAVLLRTAGIPARNVNGFLGGDWNQFGNFLTVTQNHAHSWVEVWFPQYGWLQFDATPTATTEEAAAQARRFLPFRFLMDGLEHRWNKWVLEYNLETQVDLFRRAAEAMSTPTPGGEGRKLRLPVRAIVSFALVLIVLFVIVRSLRWRSRAPVDALLPETRYYLKLRRAYQRAALASQNLPPLAFLKAIEQAPGAAHARTIVELYLESRFGRVPAGEAGRARMRVALSETQTALRRAKRAA
jgi:transglutaminase-like putative cysteine protease